MLDFAKNMAIKAIQKQAAPFLTAHCPASLQPRLAELLADEQAISSLVTYLYDVVSGNKSFNLKELDFLPISSGSNSELLNYVVPSLVSKLPIKLSSSSRFGAEIRKMLIKLLQSQASPYLLKKCPSALQTPLAQLLSDDAALSSIMSYIYDMATGEASFSMDTLQHLPMTPATRKTLSTPGLIKHVFTAIKPLLSSLPGKLSLPVPKEVALIPASAPEEDNDTIPKSTRRTRSRVTEKSDRSQSKRKKPTAAVEEDAPYSPEESTSSMRTEKKRSRRKTSTRSSDTHSIYSEEGTDTSDSVGKIALLPTLVAGGLTLSGLLSTFYTLYYAICYTPSVAYSLSAILGYVVLIAGLFMGYRWILKPCLNERDNDTPAGRDASHPQGEELGGDAPARDEHKVKIIGVVFSIVILLLGVGCLAFGGSPVMLGAVYTMVGLLGITVPWWVDKLESDEEVPIVLCIGLLVLGVLGIFAHWFAWVTIELWEIIIVFVIAILGFLFRRY